MPSGDYTATLVGTAQAGSSALKTLIDGVNITAAAFISGARMHLLQEQGSVNVITVAVTQ